MSWRRVAFSLGFAVCATVLGFGPFGLRAVLLWPTDVVARLAGGSDELFLGTWLSVWLSVYAQLFAWALVAEAVRVLWNQLRRWEAKSGARA
jgi:hypothetical protein